MENMRSGGGDDLGDPGEPDFPGVRWARRGAGLEVGPRVGSPPWLRSAARSAYLSVAGTLRSGSTGNVLRALYLHAVYDDQADAFRRLLVRLQRIGKFVTTEDLVSVARGERSVEGVEFHLSFDDGFDNNYRNAFPVLEELGVHGAFFVPSLFVDAKDEDVLANWWTREAMRRPTRPMTWPWLREMADAGHEIGSHTRHHARLSDVSGDPVRLREEVEGSKKEIEDALGRACRYISWPFGTYADFDAATRDAVRVAGYDACFSAVRGSVVHDATRIMDLPRHHFEPSWPWPHVRYFACGGGE